MFRRQPVTAYERPRYRKCFQCGTEGDMYNQIAKNSRGYNICDVCHYKKYYGHDDSRAALFEDCYSATAAATYHTQQQYTYSSSAVMALKTQVQELMTANAELVQTVQVQGKLAQDWQDAYYDCSDKCTQLEADLAAARMNNTAVNSNSDASNGGNKSKRNFIKRVIPRNNNKSPFSSSSNLPITWKPIKNQGTAAIADVTQMVKKSEEQAKAIQALQERVEMLQDALQRMKVVGGVPRLFESKQWMTESLQEAEYDWRRQYGKLATSKNIADLAERNKARAVFWKLQWFQDQKDKAVRNQSMKFVFKELKHKVRQRRSLLISMSYIENPTANSQDNSSSMSSPVSVCKAGIKNEDEDTDDYVCPSVSPRRS